MRALHQLNDDNAEGRAFARTKQSENTPWPTQVKPVRLTDAEIAEWRKEEVLRDLIDLPAVA